MITIRTESDRLISLSKAAEILGVHRCTIYVYAKQGYKGQVLETVTVGGRFRTTVQACNEFLARTDSSGCESGRSAAVELDDPHGMLTPNGNASKRRTSRSQASSSMG